MMNRVMATAGPVEPEEKLVLVIPRIVARPGEDIVWKFPNHVVTILFPTPGILDKGLIASKAKGTFTARVVDGAPPGDYEYFVYVHADDPADDYYALGESHPKIEIPGGG